MKKLLSLLFSAMLSISLFAIPARPGVRHFEQPDGTTVEAYVVGDEAGHYIIDRSGTLLVRDSKGYLVKSQAQPAHKKMAARRAERNALRAQRAERRKALAAADMDKGLVILVQFANKSFASGNTRDAFDDMLNGDNYTFNGATGSVRQYYSDQSDGKFQPDLVVYGPVTLTNNYKYYGANDEQNNDEKCGEMVAEACKLAYEQFDINLAEFDQDGDGYVDFVDILYAGYGEADYPDENTIWPCEWALSDSDYDKVLTLGGKKIDTFSCHQELDGTTRKRAGIGTACHELGHVFGLPDFYDYDYPTIGEWDVMDGGAYLNNGNTPPNFSGYERMCSGWAKPEILNTDKADVKLQNLQSSQQIYIVTETGEHNLSGTNPNPKNFYILENRQQTGWDKYLPGHGMLIWRVQYNQTWWNQNTPNARTSAKQGMAIMAADGVVRYEEDDVYGVTTYGDAGDPFPGTSGVTSYNKLPGTRQLSNIKETDGVISFTFGTPSDTPVDPTTSYTIVPDWGNIGYIEKFDQYMLWIAEYAKAGDQEPVRQGEFWFNTDVINGTFTLSDIDTEYSLFIIARAEGDTLYSNNLKSFTCSISMGEPYEYQYIEGQMRVKVTVKIDAVDEDGVTYTVPETTFESIYFGVKPVSAVENVENNNLPDLNADMYNVLGQKVNKDYRGVIIQRGAKFILR